MNGKAMVIPADFRKCRRLRLMNKGELEACVDSKLRRTSEQLITDSIPLNPSVLRCAPLEALSRRGGPECHCIKRFFVPQAKSKERGLSKPQPSSVAYSG